MNKPKHKQAFSSFSVIAVFLALMIIGVAFIPMLDISYKSSRDLPQLTTYFSWPKASPKTVEDETSKIEGILGKVSQVKNIESTSSVGNGRIVLEFDKTVDLNQKRYEVSTLLRQLRSNMPDEMSYPEIISSTANDDDAVSFMVVTLNASASAHCIEKVANQQLIPALLKINGIADISLYGATLYQWGINFDPELLKNFSLSPSEISSVINQLGDKTFLGNQQNASGSYIPILAATRQIHPDKWGNLPIANKGGRIIKLSDVATVTLKEKPPTSYYRINGKSTINLVVYAAQGENQLKLSKEIHDRLEQVRE